MSQYAKDRAAALVTIGPPEDDGYRTLCIDGIEVDSAGNLRACEAWAEPIRATFERELAAAEARGNAAGRLEAAEVIANGEAIKRIKARARFDGELSGMGRAVEIAEQRSRDIALTMGERAVASNVAERIRVAASEQIGVNSYG